MVVVAIITVLATLAITSGDRVGSPEDTSDSISSTFAFARLRAISTRKMHLVRVEPSVVSVWQATAEGFQATPTYEAVPIETMAIPPGVVAWNADTTIFAAGGASPAQNLGLAFDVEFKPDGASTGGTIFVTHVDAQHEQYRVLVYRATGSSYTREGW
jgi:hypothetical protein